MVVSLADCWGIDVGLTSTVGRHRTLLVQGLVASGEDAAAVVLHMSQPDLSHQIAAIERELGTPVVERS
jgi:uncharacterized NAD(P)/FAD-binding protein YdhS